MGLGDKAGRGLPLFNASLRESETTFRIVLVKRPIKSSVNRTLSVRRVEQGGGSGTSPKLPQAQALQREVSDEGRNLFVESM